MAEKAAKLGRDTSGVAVGQGPCVAAAARRDRGHQAAGLWSVWGDGRGPACLEALLAGMAKRGADKMRDRAYLIENREAAVSRGADVSDAAALGGCGVAGAKTQVLLGGLKCALPRLYRGGNLGRG
jgi:hypothetical protein